MRFLSNGDFLFPLSWPIYAGQQFYTWSYQNGAGNPDGIIRMPGRLLDLVVFMICGNVGFGYFYLLTSLLITFAAFYAFAKYFLGIKQRAVQIAGALICAINPITLGNLAKVGLIFAASMLPLCLIVLQRAFNRHSFGYFLLWVVLLNISLLHPYTFLVNLFVSGCYFVYRAVQDRKFIWKNIPKFILVGVVALLLNMYFLLPQLSQGTLSKDVLTNSISSAPTDYTALVDISNTGDIFTGLSLSKDVLKDFDFYDATYMPAYFLGTFLLYIILFGVYLGVEQKLSRRDKRIFTAMLAAFLILILLCTVKFLHMDVLIKALIQMPGGWAFRSPLKWQLYMPLVLCSMLVIVFANVESTWKRGAIYASLAVMFLLANGYVAGDVFHRILTPRSVSAFSALQKTDLEHKNVLFINSDRCIAFEQNNPSVTTELNQVLISKRAQVKHISQAGADTVNVGSFDYVLDCQNSSQTLLTQNYGFEQKQTFADNAFQLYKNKRSSNYIGTASHLYRIDNPSQVGDKYDFATQTLDKSFDFTGAPKGDMPLDSLQDAFETISFDNIRDRSITNDVTLATSGDQTLYIKDVDEPLYYQQNGRDIQFSSSPTPGFKTLEPHKGKSELQVNGQRGEVLHFSYTDPTFAYKNIMPNPSLEDGTWQQKVDDCYAYDDTPGKLAMNLVHDDKTDGQQSIELRAGSHIACTGPDDFAVEGGKQYLLGFDFKNIGGQYAGWYVSFDDPSETSISGRMRTDKLDTWQNFARTITVPKGAKHMHFMVYAYPDSSGIRQGTARYDDFKLAQIPNIQNRFYVTRNAGKNLAMPKSISYHTENPTKTTITVSGASTPFYLTTKETHTADWRLELDDEQLHSSWPLARPNTVSPDNHLKINGSQNGWYLDPATLCKTDSDACHKNTDGSYDIKLVMEFAPQRWFYLGVTISGLTALGTIMFFARRLRFEAPAARYNIWRR
jgi:hypothetical protein